MNPPIFDRQALLERAMDNGYLARELIGIFFEDTPKQVYALRESIERRDAEKIHRFAHKIKGASANIGGMALSKVAAEMEEAGKNSQVDKVASIVPELEKQYDLLASQLRDL